MSEVEKTKKTSSKTRAHKKGEAVKVFDAVGRRKTAVARVTLTPGSGNIIINGKDFVTYVSNRHKLISEILKPFQSVNLVKVFDAKIKAIGGGVSSQAEAIKLGIARALLKVDPAMKPLLSKTGCLVRDPRMKERKKYGRKRARRSFQYTKR